MPVGLVDAGSVVKHADLQVVAQVLFENFACDLDDAKAAGHKFDRVRHEIVEHLLEPLHVTANRPLYLWLVLFNDFDLFPLQRRDQNTHYLVDGGKRLELGFAWHE
jgi:hypothetical protein